MNKTDAISIFLKQNTLPDLAEMYSSCMEVQVNVAQDGGERVTGDYKGKTWVGWSDGLTTWKPIRIPWKANSTPEYVDGPIKFDLQQKAEAIGMTGWDWVNKVSRWVAYDFDSIVGHSEKHLAKLTDAELQEVRDAAMAIPWITVRKSTAGKGIHLYVKLAEVPTMNHNEHAALARAILGQMSALAGFDFKSKIDVCGGNMWVWARKMKGTDGLTVVKEGTTLEDVPINWRDHVKVITGTRRKNVPQDVPEDRIDAFDELTGQTPHVALDPEHKKLIEYLKSSGAYWWWDADHHMLVTHTFNLQEAHTALSLRGIFKTDSKGSNKNEQNCFACPARRGSWIVRRFSPGCKEHESWEQDGAGWTRCFLNRDPDLRIASRTMGGLEDPTGGFIFREAEVAQKAAGMLGINFDVGRLQLTREAKIKPSKDGRIVVEIKHDKNDIPTEMPGWLQKKDQWVRVFNAKSETIVVDNTSYDDYIRHLVTEAQEDGGWVIKSDSAWRIEPIGHIKLALANIGLVSKDITGALGSAVTKPWKLVSKPFEAEYPGDREWNRHGAQLRYQPSDEAGPSPTWNGILKHCGEGLDEAIKRNAWCKSVGISSGGDYLKVWVASMIREPYQPLPYLFFYSQQQNTGKSIFHEAISLLLSRGAERAETALLSQAGFNGELEGKVLCIVEEVDLRQNKQAYNRIKDWVTARDMVIHYKGDTVYSLPNTSHWVQVANNHNYCPVFPGDTRITMCHVQPLDPIDLIPKKKLIPLLEKEAPNFLRSLMDLDIPDSPDRLNLPVIETSDKRAMQYQNQDALETFISEHCRSAIGRCVKFSEFYDRFLATVDVNEVQRWSKIRVSREIPPIYPTGRSTKNNDVLIGNICFSDSRFEDKPGSRWFQKDGKLVQE